MNENHKDIIDNHNKEYYSFIYKEKQERELRDKFAMEALHGIVMRGLLSPNDAAARAYNYADAMLAERAKGEQK